MMLRCNKEVVTFVCVNRPSYCLRKELNRLYEELWRSAWKCCRSAVEMEALGQLDVKLVTYVSQARMCTQ